MPIEVKEKKLPQIVSSVPTTKLHRYSLISFEPRIQFEGLSHSSDHHDKVQPPFTFLTEHLPISSFPPFLIPDQLLPPNKE